MSYPNTCDSIIKCLKGNYDIFHPTNYDPYFLKINKKPFVITIHDMIHEKFPNYFANDQETARCKKELAYKCNHIIAVSENTKKDILYFYKDIKPEKISVIYHGNSLRKVDENYSKAEYLNNYLLFIGDRIYYKNFELFITAVCKILIEHDLYLICTGKNFSSEEIKLFENNKISDRVKHNYVSDNKLYSLYQNAIAFIFPSLYEGFGIPVLESFAAGCPAILSNASSLPEVGGDAALYFDPNSRDDMNSAIEKVVTNSFLRDELILKGKKRLKLFDWENAALRTANVYRNLV